MKSRFRSSVVLLSAIALLAVSAEAKPTPMLRDAVLAAKKPEPGLDATLATAARAMPLKTLDGSALESPASHVYLIDYATGSVLADRAGSAKMYPSSMTKMMTLYIIFGKLKDGTLALNNQFTVSQKAWLMQGSKMFVPINSQVGLEDLIRGIAIQSGNDACVVVAEGIAGSEAAFTKLMNDTAQKIGMTASHFADASGWPRPDNFTTPHDLAMLAEALVRDYPEYYHYFAEREFTYNNIRQYNRDQLLGNAALGVDGLKTGHTDAAGYGITLSAKEPGTGRRLVLVVNGLTSERERTQEGEHLLSWGFHNFKNVALFAPGQVLAHGKVWLGKADSVALAVKQPLNISVPVSGGHAAAYKATVTYKTPLTAPVAEGIEVGKLTVTFATGSVLELPLVTAAAVERKGAFGRVIPVWRSWLGI